MPARQPHPGVERPHLARRGPLGDRAPARDEQLPGVHRAPVPGAVRELLRAGHQPARRHDQADRGLDHRRGLRAAAGSSRSRPGASPARPSPSSAPAPPASPPPSSSRAPATPSPCSSATTASADCCATASRTSRWRSATSSRGCGRCRTRARGSARASRSARTSRGATCARATTRSSSPPARRCRASCPIPGRDLAGVHFAMEYLVESNKAIAGRLGAEPDHGRGQARRRHRRRRHRRRLHRHRAPSGRAERDQPRDRPPAPGRAARAPAVADDARPCSRCSPRTKRAASAPTSPRPSSSSATTPARCARCASPRPSSSTAAACPRAAPSARSPPTSCSSRWASPVRSATLLEEQLGAQFTDARQRRARGRLPDDRPRRLRRRRRRPRTVAHRVGDRRGSCRRRARRRVPHGRDRAARSGAPDRCRDRSAARVGWPRPFANPPQTTRSTHTDETRQDRRHPRPRHVDL